MLVCLGVLNNVVSFFARFFFVFKIWGKQKTPAFLAASFLRVRNKRKVLFPWTMKLMKHLKLVYKSFDISRTLLIKGVICCKLKQFILAVSNSTVWAILMLWFQREDSAEINRRKVLTSCRTCLMTISECLVPRNALTTCVIIYE